MSNKNTLPIVLALASTLVVLGLGYIVFNKIVSSSFIASKSNNAKRKIGMSIADRNISSKTISAISFSEPRIVPMGISVKINGSERMEKVNKLLQRSFQREFPGTTVNIDTDGNETGMRLLLSGQVDLAAISRPLSKEERAQGLTAVAMGDGNYSDEAERSDSESLFYAYQEPANIKVEAFLGYLLSARGQESIINRDRLN